MDGQKEALQAVAAGSIFRATSALKIEDIGNAVVDLSKQVLEKGSAENLLLQPELVDTPDKAKALIAKFGGGARDVPIVARRRVVRSVRL